MVTASYELVDGLFRELEDFALKLYPVGDARRVRYSLLATSTEHEGLH